MKTKYALLLCMIVFMPKELSTNRFKPIQYTSVCPYEYNYKPKKPNIVPREDYYDNKVLLNQNKLKHGEWIYFNLRGKRRVRKIRRPSYSELGVNYIEIYSKIIIHHTQFEVKGDAFEQALLIRDSQVIDRKYKFSDIAYHFVISTDGCILEGAAMTHMGRHAGKVKEAEKIINSAPLEAFKLMPDYGAVGIVLFGDLNKHKPTEEQIDALILLLDWLLSEYSIPVENIFYHKEVQDQIIKASGLTPYSKENKTCPGNNFPEEKDLFARISTENSEEACEKSFLIPK